MSVILMNRIFSVALAAITIILLGAAPLQAKDRYDFTFQPNPRDLIEPGDETKELRIAQQYGIAYLPLMVMRQQRLIEKHAHQLKLGNLRVTWQRYSSGQEMNQALKTGFLHVASGGVVPMLQAWDKSRKNEQVKGIAALGSMPLYLNTTNPKITSIRDLTDKDRIALPAVRTSIQAVILQMAAEQTFGKGQHNRLDKLTVSMSHPLATQAMILSKPEVTAHLTSPPYTYQELDYPHIKRVFSSYEILRGPATFNVLWSTQSFRAKNPKTIRAVYNALQEAITIIQSDYQYAADVYTQQGGGELSPKFIDKIMANPEVMFSNIPLNVMKYAKFMHKTGMIKNKPADWYDVFFDDAHVLPGS